MTITCLGVVAVLPDPEFGDSLAARPQVLPRTMASGRVRSLVKRTDRRRLGFTVEVTLAKAEELIAIFKANSTKMFNIVSATAGINFSGYLQTNPVQATNTSGELYSLTLEFQ